MGFELGARTVPMDKVYILFGKKEQSLYCLEDSLNICNQIRAASGNLATAL